MRVVIIAPKRQALQCGLLFYQLLTVLIGSSHFRCGVRHASLHRYKDCAGIRKMFDRSEHRWKKGVTKSCKCCHMLVHRTFGLLSEHYRLLWPHYLVDSYCMWMLVLICKFSMLSFYRNYKVHRRGNSDFMYFHMERIDYFLRNRLLNRLIFNFRTFRKTKKVSFKRNGSTKGENSHCLQKYILLYPS